MNSHAVIIQFKNSGGTGTCEEQWFRHRHEIIFDNILKFHDLGYCEGGATGAGTMEIFFFVSDIERTVKILKQALTKLDLLGEAKIAGCFNGSDEITVYYPKGATFSLWDEVETREPD